jgi:hypothetical protein
MILLGGIFVVLVIGLVLSIFVAILEFCWSAKRNANSDRVDICSEMAEEARIAFQCRGPRRRPALVTSCGRCRTGAGKSPQPTAYHDYHTYPHQHPHYHPNINGMPQRN